MTIEIRFEAYVGTTYKRALTKKIPVRDRLVPHCLRLRRHFLERPRYHPCTQK